LWRELTGARIFITGGTGFFGIWLLESIAAANDILKVDVRATVLSRNPQHFALKSPRLAARPEFEWLTGNTANFVFPAKPCDYVMHLATASAAELGAGDATLSLATLLGTQRILKFSCTSGIRRLLFASSGAVYGRQPMELSHIPETYVGGPNPRHAASAYGEIKRMSELMCALTPELECVIARGFSFIGPGMPLTEKFAIGSFIGQALAGGPIRIRSDGTPVRSYLYAADLVIWLLTLLLKGKPNHPYNVGSDQTINLVELAQHIATTTGDTMVEIARALNAVPAEHYVPDIQRARSELGLDVFIPLSPALRRTLDWAKQTIG
jgi:dTDP-glucose 4,6-dehydratase